MEQNRFVENFISRLRDDCLNEHLFAGLNHARPIIEDWRIDYNTQRPHTSLNGLTPHDYASQRGGSPERFDGSTIGPVAYPGREVQNQNGLSL